MVLVAAAAAVLAAGCGDAGDEPELSRTTASSLRADLTQISQSVRDGNCTTAQQATANLQSEIDALRGEIGAKLRRALSDSAERLETLVRDQCEPATTPAPVVTPEPTQETDQTDEGNEENQDKPNKDKKNKEKSKEVPPGQQDGGNGTTPPGQQDGDTSPDGDTGGASPEGD